jgi:hypothetical protein
MLACFSWADLPLAGIATDIAGAVILGLSFAFKSPEDIAVEAPETVSASTPLGSHRSDTPMRVGLPPQLRASMIRQRAEARLGLVLLVIGFVLQAFAYLFEGGLSFQSWSQRGVAALLCLLIWLLAYPLFRWYVPWEERRTKKRIDREVDRSAAG